MTASRGRSTTNLSPKDLARLNREIAQAEKTAGVAGPFKRRKLRKGEAVEVPALGVPGIKLTGAIRVREYEDGTVIPEIPRLSALLETVFLRIILTRGNFNADQLRFIRQQMQMTQQELADLIGTSNARLSRLENGKDEITRQFSDQLRFHAIIRVMNTQPPNVRRKNQKLYAAIQDALSHMPEHATESHDIRIDMGELVFA